MARCAVLLPLLVAAFFAAASDADEKRTRPLKRVAEITDVKFELQTSEPPNLVVTATGNVPTGGWTDVQLIRREYVKPPADGIYEYDLLARPPDGVATQVITKVQASDTWEAVDAAKLKGIRVYGLGEGIKTVKAGSQ